MRSVTAWICEQTDGGLICVELITNSCTVEMTEDNQEERRLVSLDETVWEDPSTPLLNDCHAFHQKTDYFSASIKDVTFKSRDIADNVAVYFSHQHTELLSERASE